MEPLKNMYHAERLRALAKQIATVDQRFNTNQFVEEVVGDNWNELELKGRMHKVSYCIGRYLPADYLEALDIILRIDFETSGFINIVFPGFVEIYGQDERYLKQSLFALKHLTRYSSSEYAIRPFLIKYPHTTFTEMMMWAKDDNEHVRRLASEGIRPALPWACALPEYKKNPQPIFMILEQLKNDPALYVRKSVANNLNDISKTHPDLVIEKAYEWFGKSKHTDWIIKHGCRTLLKKGDSKIMKLFGYDQDGVIVVDQFSIKNTDVIFKKELTFSFEIRAIKDCLVRMEYIIGYQKANGTIKDKIFKISETTMVRSETKKYEKSHPFIDLTTRKHYMGKHTLTLVINGIKQDTLIFELLASC